MERTRAPANGAFWFACEDCVRFASRGARRAVAPTSKAKIAMAVMTVAAFQKDASLMVRARYRCDGSEENAERITARSSHDFACPRSEENARRADENQAGTSRRVVNASGGASTSARCSADELCTDSALRIGIAAGIVTAAGISADNSSGVTSASRSKLGPNSKPFSALACARAALKVE